VWPNANPHRRFIALRVAFIGSFLLVCLYMGFLFLFADVFFVYFSFFKEISLSDGDSNNPDDTAICRKKAWLVIMSEREGKDGVDNDRLLS
jgi:hypothetical protein